MDEQEKQRMWKCMLQLAKAVSILGSNFKDLYTTLEKSGVVSVEYSEENEGYGMDESLEDLDDMEGDSNGNPTYN